MSRKVTEKEQTLAFSIDTDSFKALAKSNFKEIEKASECARLHRILSKDEQSAIVSIQLENGDYTTEKETLEELFRVHFPGSEIILEPSGGWNGLELEFPKWKGSRGGLGGVQKGRQLQ